MRQMALDSLQEVIENIRSIAELVEPEEDGKEITALHDRIDKEASKRKHELDKAYADLKALARVLDAARTSSTRPPSVPPAEQHAKNLNYLDAARLSFVKALNDAESAVASKQAELTRLKEELRQLEQSDPAAEHELDGTPLRLQILHGLGIKPILDDSGNPDRVLVESTSNDMHVIKFGTGTPEEDLVEQIWKLSLS